MSDAAQPMRTQQALRAAHLYYLQDLTMDAIADELGTSRSSVSRLLKYARDTGSWTSRSGRPSTRPPR